MFIKTTIATAIISTGMYLSADVLKSEKIVKRRGQEFLEQIYRCELLNNRFIIKNTINKSTGENHVSFAGNAGRWHRFIYFLKKGGKIGNPEAVTSLKKPDGSVIAKAIIPVLENGKRCGSISCMAIQLPQYPKFTFYRFTNSAPNVGILCMYLGVIMLPQPLTKVSRTLFLAWPGGKIAIGGKVPWFKTKPKFHAIAWYSRGGKEDAMAEFMLFDSSQFKAISPTRWKTNDDRASLRFAPESTEITYALGCSLSKNENAEKIAVPEFFKEKMEEVYKIMKGLNWEMKADWSALSSKLNELEKLLKNSSSVDIKKEFSTLKANFKGAEKKGDDAQVSVLEKQIRALKTKASKSMLNDLL